MAVEENLHSFKRFFTSGELLAKLNPKNLIPHRYVRTINDIDVEALVKAGIKGVIWDVDGNLMGYHQTEVDPRLKDKFEEFISSSLENVVLSNSNDKRFEELARIFAGYQGVKVLRMYEKKGKVPGQRFVYRVIEGGVDNLYYDNVGRMTPLNADNFNRSGYDIVKKPSKQLIEYAIFQMRINDPKQAAMIGDNGFTDIMGGNFAGCYTLQTKPPLDGHLDPIGSKIAKYIEYGIAYLCNFFRIGRKEDYVSRR